MEMKNRGVTMIELMMIMILSVIVTSAIYSLYGFFIKSVHQSNQYTNTEQSSYRKLGMITSLLRRSEQVLSITPVSVTFLTSSGDTLSLSYSENTLYRNSPSEEQDPWIVFDSFSILSPQEDSGWMNLTISGTYQGRFNNYHTINSNVVIYRKPEVVGEEDWGFWD